MKKQVTNSKKAKQPPAESSSSEEDSDSEEEIQKGILFGIYWGTKNTPVLTTVYYLYSMCTIAHLQYVPKL